MSHAIFTVAVGEEWWERAARLVRTLRTLGQYDRWPIVVYTDGPIDADCETRDSDRLYEQTFQGDYEVANIQAIRIKAAMELAEQYETLIYLDADCLCIRPITPMLDVAHRDYIYVQPERRDILAGESRYHNGYMDLMEKQTSQPPLNSGSWVAGCNLINNRMQEWWNILVNDDYGFSASHTTREQAAFNAWILRNWGKWDYLPSGWVHIGTTEPPENAMVIHTLHTGLDMHETIYEGLRCAM